MTHVAHPYALRLGIVNDWRSRWFDKRQYRVFLKEDTLLRAYLKKELKDAFIESIDIERSPGILHVILKTSQPGLLIGRSGEGAERIKEKVRRFIMRMNRTGKLSIKLSIEEVRFPETRAHIVAQMVGQDLEKRIPFRRVLKSTIEKVSSNKNVKGIKIALKGRLDGAEMGRYEWLKRGRIPLQTLRADIDFAEHPALLPYGTIGIKIWIYRGEVFEQEKDTEKNKA
jgi:small subunit ribosomal protein S3